MRGGLHLDVLAGKGAGFKFASFYMVAGHLHLLFDGVFPQQGAKHRTSSLSPLLRELTQFPCVT